MWAARAQGEESDEYQAARHVYYSRARAKKKAFKRQQADSIISKILGSEAAEGWRLFRGQEERRAVPPREALTAAFRALHDQVDPARAHGGGGNPFANCRTLPERGPPVEDFTEGEVRAAIARLKRGKAADRLGLRAELLKAVEEEVAPEMADLFNNFLHNGFPDALAESIIVPIYKKGDPLDPGNYRGISILPLLAKLYASCLNERITTLCEPVRARGQAGFRRDHRTADHIFTLEAWRRKARSSRRWLYTCFVDFSKAFDSVSRDLLLQRLESLGLPPLLLRAVDSYYSSTTCRVRAGDGLSEAFPSTIGVKQGCPLSPTLFGILIDFFEEFVATRLAHFDPAVTYSLLYADDLTILSESEETFRALLQLVDDFSTEMHLKVNVDKTKIVVFRGRVTAQVPEFQLAGQGVEVVDSFRYLGFELHCVKGVTFGCEALVQSARRAIFALNQRCSALKLTDVRTRLYLFDALVRPILLYGCEIWLPFLDSDKWMTCPVELVHRGFLRHFFRLRKTTSMDALMLEFGRFPLAVSAMRQTMKYYNRLITMDPERLLKTAFDSTQHLAGTWIQRLGSQLHNFGMELPTDPDGRHLPIDVDRVSNSIRLHQLQHSVAALTGERAGRRQQAYAAVAGITLDRVLAPGFELVLPPYLAAINVPYKAKEVICHFRLGHLHLEVERGAWGRDRVAREQRFCRLCQHGRGVQLVEDEGHFLFDCAALQPARDQHATLPFGQRSIYIILNHDDSIQLGLYLAAALQLRSELLAQQQQ
jgi:hypothetical protein